jgi:hypothetical protein
MLIHDVAKRVELDNLQIVTICGLMVIAASLLMRGQSAVAAGGLGHTTCVPTHEMVFRRRRVLNTVIPFLDLGAQYGQIKAEIDAAIGAVIDSAQFGLGSEVAAFEERFATYCGTRYCVAVNGGTSALHLAMLASGMGPGDDVITVSMTFVATTAAILYCGAKPVFVDISPEAWTMDPNLIEWAATPSTKAILPVHLRGLIADMDPIVEVARRHGLVMIEDAAQSDGAKYKGRSAGSIGDIGCFSVILCASSGSSVTAAPPKGQVGLYREMDRWPAICCTVLRPPLGRRSLSMPGTACTQSARLPRVCRASSAARSGAQRASFGRYRNRHPLSGARSPSEGLCGPRI